MLTKTKKKLGPGDDAEMICNPQFWPSFVVLPLKRRNAFEERNLGLLFDEPREAGYRVFLTNMFMLPMPKEEFDKVERINYPSVEALLADGWVVD